MNHQFCFSVLSISFFFFFFSACNFVLLTCFYVDEIDSVCRQRSQSEDEHTRRIKNELLRMFDSVGPDSKTVVLASTNRPWELDPAFLRRFQKKIYVGLPDLESRKALIKVCGIFSLRFVCFPTCFFVVDFIGK
jgi:AAA+ superfamily predicted ATPase